MADVATDCLLHLLNQAKELFAGFLNDIKNTQDGIEETMFQNPFLMVLLPQILISICLRSEFELSTIQNMKNHVVDLISVLNKILNVIKTNSTVHKQCTYISILLSQFLFLRLK